MNVLTAENSTRVRKADATDAVPAAPFRLGYRPGLDGLRGAAIMTVVLAHLFESPRPVGFLGAGFAGVNTFFVLSGFLITSLLIEEWDESGKISFPAFYARRALRLLPALLVMVLCFLIYARLTHGNRQFHDDLTEARATVFYYMNWLWAFNVVPITLLRHTWSLSLEEQFYLVWPPVLWLLLRFAGRRSILNFIILGIFCSGGLRFLMTAIEQPEVHHYVRFLCGLDTRADSLLVGCGLAVLLASDLFLAVIRRKKNHAFHRHGVSGDSGHHINKCDGRFQLDVFFRVAAAFAMRWRHHSGADFELGRPVAARLREQVAGFYGQAFVFSVYLA